jgi:ferritin
VVAARDHELKVTKWIHELVALAEEEKDYSTRSFLQWYVDEQVQEVSAAEELVSLVKLAGTSGMLYLEDRLKGMMPNAAGEASAPA